MLSVRNYNPLTKKHKLYRNRDNDDGTGRQGSSLEPFDTHGNVLFFSNMMCFLALCSLAALPPEAMTYNVYVGIQVWAKDSAIWSSCNLCCPPYKARCGSYGGIHLDYPIIMDSLLSVEDLGGRREDVYVLSPYE